MTAIAKREKDKTDLAALPTDALRAELAQQMTVTAQHLQRLASIVAELERRGEDLSELKVGMLGYLRRIAAGQLHPDAVVRYLDYPMLLNRVATLPVTDQERLATGEPIKLVVWREGKTETRMMDPIKLTRDQVSQVFGPGAIRDEVGQIAVLESRFARPEQHAKPTTTGKCRADRKTGTVRVGRYVVPASDLVAALADLRDEGEDTADADKTIPVMLTETQHRKLRVRAAEGGKSMADLVRTALRASGLI